MKKWRISIFGCFSLVCSLSVGVVMAGCGVPLEGGVHRKTDGGLSLSKAAGASVIMPPAPEVSMLVGPAGGTVTLTRGKARGAKIEIPPGALPRPAMITMAAYDSPTAMPDKLTHKGPAVVFGPEGQQFLRPVTITLPASSGAHAIYTRPLSENTWSPEAAPRYNPAQNTMTVSATHFSLKQAIGFDTPTPAGKSPDWGNPSVGYLLFKQRETFQNKLGYQPGSAIPIKCEPECAATVIEVNGRKGLVTSAACARDAKEAAVGRSIAFGVWEEICGGEGKGSDSTRTVSVYMNHCDSAHKTYAKQRTYGKLLEKHNYKDFLDPQWGWQEKEDIKTLFRVVKIVENKNYGILGQAYNIAVMFTDSPLVAPLGDGKGNFTDIPVPAMKLADKILDADVLNDRGDQFYSGHVISYNNSAANDPAKLYFRHSRFELVWKDSDGRKELLGPQLAYDLFKEDDSRIVSNNFDQFLKNEYGAPFVYRPHDQEILLAIATAKTDRFTLPSVGHDDNYKLFASIAENYGWIEGVFKGVKDTDLCDHVDRDYSVK